MERIKATSLQRKVSKHHKSQRKRVKQKTRGVAGGTQPKKLRTSPKARATMSSAFASAVLMWVEKVEILQFGSQSGSGDAKQRAGLNLVVIHMPEDFRECHAVHFGNHGAINIRR